MTTTEVFACSWKNNFDWSSGLSAVEIVRRQDATVLRLNIWAAPRKLTHPVTFTFGLHATPSKPLPRNWQTRYVTFGEAGTKLPNSYVSLWHKDQNFYSYPQPAEAASYVAKIKQHHQSGKRVCTYFTPAGTSPDVPTVKRHYDNWIGTRSNGKPLWIADSVDTGTSRNVCLCTASRYVDFMAWGLEQFLQEYGVDGLYFDNSCPYPCANSRHGCGVKESLLTPFLPTESSLNGSTHSSNSRANTQQLVELSGSITVAIWLALH